MKRLHPVPVSVGDADGLLDGLWRLRLKSLQRPSWEWDRSAFWLPRVLFIPLSGP